MFRYLPQALNRILLIHEHEPAYDRIKRLIEFHGGWIAHEKRNVGIVAADSARVSPFHGRCGSIHAYDLPTLTYQIGG